MLEIRHLKPSDYKVVPWKNHRGTTSEIAIFPEDSNHLEDSFDWRVSSAWISSSCSFSQFLGYDRVIVMLEGDSMDLNHDCAEAPQTVRRLVPYPFKGEWQTTCEINDQAVRDFNLISRRGKVSCDLKVMRVEATPCEKACTEGHLLIFCVSGELEILGPALKQTLFPNESLMIRNRDQAPGLLRLRSKSGVSEIISITIAASGEGAPRRSRRQNSPASIQ